VHNAHTTAADYDFAISRNKNISWVLCPRSNLYIENALPPVQMLRAKGASIALGTDSLASNRSLSMLDELKCLAQNFPDIPFSETLRWATLGGAEALRREGVLGSLEPGKRPGVVLLEGFDCNRLTISEVTTSQLLAKND
jgi:cytosine/adenosine deaminase-related metal-dependent hydrolase